MAAWPTRRAAPPRTTRPSVTSWRHGRRHDDARFMEGLMADRALTKEETRQARAVADAAYKAELSVALEELAVLFGDWHKGRIDASQLADAIHQFHDGQSRELFKRYRGS